MKELTNRTASGSVDTASEWSASSTGMTLGLLLFETISGLAIYLFPFSVFNQYSVLLHTLIGSLMIVPVGWYLGRHWWRRFRGNFNHYQLLGYFSAAALLVLVVSGVVLTWQALFHVRIDYTWDIIHIIVTFMFIAALGAHLGTLLCRRSSNDTVRRRMRQAYAACVGWTAVWAGGALAACVMLAWSYRPVDLDHAFPSDYSFKYGIDRPFAPSLARTDMAAVRDRLQSRILTALTAEQGRFFMANFRTDPQKHEGWVTVAKRLCDGMELDDGQQARVGTAIDDALRQYREQGRIHPRELSGSVGCGTSGCHTEIVAEWQPSAHRYASMDFVFQEVQANMADELAPEATRYCAGCHDPIALFSGAKNVGNVTLSAEGSDEGVSCLVCHVTVQTDVRGNADYTIRPPLRYIYELHDGQAAKLISDFLIRAFPRHHIASYSRPLYKTAEACAACHKQFIDEELNEVGFVQGQNQYDSWRKSRWHSPSDPSKTIGCRECHMPLVASNDPATGDRDDPNRSPDDGKHRSHRFLAANQFIPRHHQLPGAEEHCDLTVKWLRGEYDIPEIADRWTDGPVIRLTIRAPETVRPGEEVVIQTILTNNKTGHDFPTGPMDMIEAWVEVEVTDESGQVIFASGRTDERGYLVEPEIVFKGEPIDRHGQLVGKHELWNKVGSRFKRSLFPGFSDTVDFTFECPAMPSDSRRKAILEPNGEETFTVPHEFASGRLKVTAVLRYRKFSAPFLDRLFGPQAGLRSEITDMSRAEAEIRVTHGDR